MRSVRQCGRHHVFKPASVQALWTAIQTLHLISARLKVPLVAALRIRDVYPGSEFFHPGWVKKIQDPGSRLRIQIKEFKYF